MKLYKIIKEPILTEHTYRLIQNYNKYTFAVDANSNKTELKKTFAKLFGVTVIKINLLNQKPRSRTVGRQKGFTGSIRKAIFTLKPGDTIEVLGQVSQEYKDTNIADLKASLDQIDNLKKQESTVEETKDTAKKSDEKTNSKKTADKKDSPAKKTAVKKASPAKKTAAKKDSSAKKTAVKKVSPAKKSTTKKEDGK